MELLVIEHGRRRLVPTRALKPGKEGNLQTLAVLLPMIRRDAQDVELRRFVLGLIANCPNDFESQVGKLFEYARSIRFTRDPLDAERIADAATTIDEQAGDCGDKSELLSSMLGSIGYLCKVRALNFYDDLATHGYDHLLVRVQDDAGQWQSLDATPEHSVVGYEPPAPVVTDFDIWPDAATGVGAGPFDALLGQGLQLGTQLIAGAVQHGKVSKAQEAALGKQFDSLAGQVTALFNRIQSQAVITMADVQQAAAAYAQLAQVAQENATAYITEQWNSQNYKPAYEARLNQMAAASSEQQTVNSQTPDGGLLSSVPSVSSLFSNPLALVALALVGIALVKRS